MVFHGVSCHWTCKLPLIALLAFSLVAGFYSQTAYAAVPEAGFSARSSGFKHLLIYYGWLNTSNVLGLNADIVVVAGSERILSGGGDYSVVSQLIGKGVMVFAYLEDLNGGEAGAGGNGDSGDDKPVGLGSSFESMVYGNSTGTLSERYYYWLSYMKSIVDNYKGAVSGVFLDECDPGYFTDNLSDDAVKYFTWGIGNLTEYAHSKGLMVFVNGVMGYAGYGDYYLWEDFLDSYENGYILQSDFLENQSYTSPLEWVNGIARYYYLKNHGLLNRTIAVSFVDSSQRETLEWGRAAYLLARIMGLAGWGYGNYTYYASGGSVPTGILGIFETGIPVGDPVFADGMAWRFFLASGNTSVTVGDTGVSSSMDPGYTFPTLHVIVDGVNSGEYQNLLQTPVNGTSSTLNYLGIVNSQNTLYYLVNWTYTSQSSSGGLLHIYLNTDGDTGTGYQVDGLGADYLVEVTTDGSGILYCYNGTGTDWNWNSEGYLNTVVKNNGLSYQVELAVDKNKLSNLENSKAEYTVRTVYNWGDDASSDKLKLGEMQLLYPNFYEPETGLESYTGVVLSSELTQNKLVIISNGPPGVIVNYTIVTPFETFNSVLVNGSELQQGINSSGLGWEVKKTWNGYSEVMILAEHHSLINITILGSEASPVPESGYLFIGVYTGLVLLVFLFYRKTGG